MRQFPALLLLLSPALLMADETPPEPAWVGQSRQLANQLGGQLKAELTQAIADGGAVAAISVCRKRAPEIAAQLSAESGARVGRTALRLRSPANAPDEQQHAVLEQFSTELASGKAAGPLEAVLEIRRGASVERLYMRAIPTDAVCLTCHGTTLAPEVAAAVARDYPADQATGFELGQLRGAFTVTWPAVPLPAAR